MSHYQERMKQNWTYKKLGEVCEIYQPKTISTEMLCSDGEFLVYGANGVIGRYNQYNHEESEVLMTCRGATCGTINISEPHSWINGNAMVIHPKTNDTFHSRTFLVYLLRSLDLSTIITGCAQPQITRMSLAPLVIPLPPLETQSRIVAELDLLQAIIDKQKAQLAELDNLAQCIFYDMFGDPVENEKGWEVKRLGDVCIKITDGVHAKPTYTEFGMPFISVVNINRGVLDFNNCKFVSQIDGETFNKRANPQKGDILYTKVGATYGIPAVVDTDKEFCLYVSVCLIKPKHNIIDSVFLKNQMGAPYVKEQADKRIRGIGVPDLHLNQISDFEIVLPPLTLQQEFAEKIEKIERQKTAISQSIAETRKLFDYTMDKYFG